MYCFEVYMDIVGADSYVCSDCVKFAADCS